MSNLSKNSVSKEHRRGFLPATAMLRTLLRMKYRYNWGKAPTPELFGWVKTNLVRYSAVRSEVLFGFISRDKKDRR